MTGRTHDLAAITALNAAFVYAGFPQMTFGTASIACIAAVIGGIVPDLDQPTARMWQRIPLVGGVFAQITRMMTGGHRLTSHSLLGLAIAGLIARLGLDYIHSFILVDMDIVWWSFMIGMLSHLVIDSFTREGVPWLFPIPVRVGFPPLQFLRLTTGGMLEKGIVFPGLIIANVYLGYVYYNQYLIFAKSLR